MLLFGIWFFLRHDDYSSDRTAFQVTLIKVVDLAILVYITNYVLIPRLFYKKRYGWFVLVFIIMIASSSILKMRIIGEITNNLALINFAGAWKDRVYDNMIPHFFLVTAGAAIKLMVDYTEMQKRLVEVAKEKAETELNFLKSQINPHFLFNSLNSVYFLIDKNNIHARQALHKFSEMLRYQLYEMGGETIPIEKEIRYLRDYLDLQKLRKNENFSVHFNCDPAVKDFSIQPLLLIPFLENAFKHISHYKDEPNYVNVDLSRKNGSFNFSVENSKEDGIHLETTSGGIGLPNVSRRLELLYPGKHELKIDETNTTYSIHLEIRLT